MAAINGQGEPVVPSGCHRVLDLGSGDGSALADSYFPRGATIFATEVNLDALQRCHAKFPAAMCVCSKGENLPYRSNAFDAYVARSSWPYTNLPRTTQEAFRVLAPRGHLWVSTRTHAGAMRMLKANIRRRYAHGIVFHAYVLFNGLILHLTGKIIRFPFRWPGMSRYESFHTRRAMRHLLRRAGFGDVHIDKSRFMQVTARKPD